MNYFIKVDGEEKGPLSAEQIRLRLAEKSLKGDDLVRQEDSTAWVPLGSLQEFLKVTPPWRSAGNPMAYLSLGLGVVTLLSAVVLTQPEGLRPLFLIAGILAIISGSFALRKVRRNHGSAGGSVAAKAGIGLAYFTILMSVFGNLNRGGNIREKGNITKGISNCRQIITTLRLYSSDNRGKYPDSVLPDAKSSNAVFRQMFVGEQADNEMIFGCPSCIDGVPDGNIGTKPDYREAVQANENHWAMTKGLTDSSDAKIPLVYENPQDATWPPKWNPDAKGTGKPGRSWTGGKVIIGFNDSSVMLMPLESASGEHVGLKPDADGKPVFPDLHPKPEILAPEVKQ